MSPPSDLPPDGTRQFAKPRGILERQFFMNPPPREGSFVWVGGAHLAVEDQRAQAAELVAVVVAKLMKKHGSTALQIGLDGL